MQKQGLRLRLPKIVTRLLSDSLARPKGMKISNVMGHTAISIDECTQWNAQSSAINLDAMMPSTRRPRVGSRVDLDAAGAWRRCPGGMGAVTGSDYPVVHSSADRTGVARTCRACLPGDSQGAIRDDTGQGLDPEAVLVYRQ